MVPQHHTKDLYWPSWSKRQRQRCRNLSNVVGNTWNVGILWEILPSPVPFSPSKMQKSLSMPLSPPGSVTAMHFSKAPVCTKLCCRLPGEGAWTQAPFVGFASTTETTTDYQIPLIACHIVNGLAPGYLKDLILPQVYPLSLTIWEPHKP